MTEASRQPSAQTATTDQASVFDQVVAQTAPTVGLEREHASRLIRGLVEGAIATNTKFDKNVIRTLKNAISQIDEALTRQVSAIMHHPQFQKLEGSWRGFHHLVMNTETSTSLKIRMLNVSKDDLRKSFDQAVEFDQSILFKKLYEDEFGMAGGEPFGALIGDYEFTKHPNDIEMLEKVSGVAAAAFCPFISAASPELFGLQSYTDLSKPRDLSMIFEAKEYIKWKAFRDSPDSRFVSLVLPRVLSRLPYGRNNKTCDEFNFEEVSVDERGKDTPLPHDHYTWMNAAYVYGTRLTEAFAKYNWCTAIRGAQNGGKVEGLPVHVFKTDDGDESVKCPSEVAITERRDAELSKLGFMSLVYYKNTDYSVFFSGQSTQKPKVYDTAEATANAAVCARLPYVMAASRISHYLKVIGRDWIGSFKETGDLNDYLNRWISEYVSADPNPSEENKRKYPLKEAKVVVEEIPGRPGSYNAVAHLRPFLQMEELTTSIRMVASIPQKK